MTSTTEATIEADPKVPLVRITREFDASPAKVFRAHTDPDLLVKWLGPNRIEMEITESILLDDVDRSIMVLETRVLPIAASVRQWGRCVYRYWIATAR